MKTLKSLLFIIIFITLSACTKHHATSTDTTATTQYVGSIINVLDLEDQSLVEVNGIITTIDDSGNFFIQDNTAGIYVSGGRDFNFNITSSFIGKTVRISGLKEDIDGLTQIKMQKLGDIFATGTGSIPTPIGISDFSTLNYFVGQRISLLNVMIQDNQIVSVDDSVIGTIQGGLNLGNQVFVDVKGIYYQTTTQSYFIVTSLDDITDSTSTLDQDKLDITSNTFALPDEIKLNYQLPTDAHGVSISWQSLTETVALINNQVTLNTSSENSVSISLKATFTIGSLDPVEKIFLLTLNPNLQELEVDFIDVDQADSIYIQLPNGQHMLIDAGTDDQGPHVVDFLKSKGVTTLDYVVGTHPHADHIGGLDNVINAFDIENVYMPNKTYTTSAYRSVINAVANKGLTITTAKAGVVLFDETFGGKSLKAVMIAPVNNNYGDDDINDYSAVIKLTYGDKSFLFMGDAEALSESEILATGVNVHADVLKVGHHGSYTASSAAFLDAATPSIAVISCGVNNSYGHPHQETLDKLNARDITIYRTDLQGTITIISDGSNLSVQTSGK